MLALPEANRPEKIDLTLEFMGHYSENKLKLTVNLEELIANGSIVYEMVMDSKTGRWELVVMQDPDRNMVGVAEFTQFK